MVGIGAKANLPATGEFWNVGTIVGVIMICMAALPLSKARVASGAFQDIEFGSAILYFVTQSNQNWTALTASGVFNCAVLRSGDRKFFPICMANVHQIFQGSKESEGSISAPYTPADALVNFCASWTNSVQVLGGPAIPACWNMSLL